MKIRVAAIMLIVVSSLQILMNLMEFRGRIEYFGYNQAGTLVSLLMPLSLLFLGIALLKIKEGNQPQFDIMPEVKEQPIGAVPSIGDWIVIFLITIIPLVGLIFVIIWANDDKNKVRKNWAIASLIWWGILIAFSFFLFSTVLSSLIGELI